MIIAPVGLYSISVRGFDVPDMLRWAAAHGVPFLHLRGGPRGMHLSAQPTRTVLAWAKTAADTVPITGVTADVDLADLLTGDRSRRQRAATELAHLAKAAYVLGAGWVRLLARTPLAVRVLAEAAAMPALAGGPMPLLVELHHPGWLAPGAFAALTALIDSCPRMRLLADTAQLAAATPTGHATAARLGLLLDRTQVVHLSDNDAGLDAPGHTLVAALAADRIITGQRMEVAVEWTGGDRTPAVCLARYRAAVAWWQQLVFALEPQ
ncbi:hypothetical protein SAMN05216275_119101 [Streptosporangium canum]|uniref:Xylose isomerase-like TIM barrel domain-containing protein n=1 Tax=Streptosporangium canum TaxID=324952 RepID=A0A1I3XKR4_9ACTN|nr:TIM barrel protein [Streptosporangium canum]SFK20085.1 hypothetical protein SAMN05216275_119101 [Streptosporangium canum]